MLSVSRQKISQSQRITPQCTKDRCNCNYSQDIAILKYTVYSLQCELLILKQEYVACKETQCGQYNTAVSNVSDLDRRVL